MGAHATVWEDGGMAGITCNGKEAGTLDAEWVKCPECGEEIKLSWLVAVIERPTLERRRKK